MSRALAPLAAQVDYWAMAMAMGMDRPPIVTSGTHCFEFELGRLDASAGTGLILLTGCCAGDADCADDIAGGFDRNASD